MGITLPTIIKFGQSNISTFGLFLLFGFFLVAFVAWQEGRKDGFDEERVFDILLVSTVSGLIFSRLFFALFSRASIGEALNHTLKFWTPGMDIYGALLGVFLPIYLLCKYWKWSIYRIFDIFSLAWSLGLAVVMLGYVGIQQRFQFLFAFASWLVIYGLLSKLRNSKIRSGGVFALFLLVNVLLGVIFFRDYKYLIFYTLLVTLTVVVLYFRERKSAVKANIPTNILAKIKNTLLSKEKRISAEQALLIKEDPYLNEGRVNDNADVQDDTYEDIEHANVTLRINSLANAKLQVKKALSRMNLGTYGICETCGTPIEAKRLEAYPEATTCLKCAEAKQ